MSVESDPPQSIHRDPIRPLVTPLVLSVINLHLLEMASLVVSLALGEIYFHSTLAFCRFGFGSWVSGFRWVWVSGSRYIKLTNREGLKKQSLNPLKLFF